MISFENPKALFALLALIPSVSYSLFYISKITRSLGVLYGDDSGSSKKYTSLKRALYLRTVCFSLSWISLTAALSGPSWLTSSVPVQKTGTAVSFVFDISYSMNALDAVPEGSISRLSASSQYASILLNRLYENSRMHPAVSIVLSKGEGLLALPFSEDYYSAVSFFSSLSPSLMTAPGSNLGSGIRCAMRSFPSNHARYSTILLFTDGDETDSNLQEAAGEALRYGINVVIIGFGSTQPSQVLTGDGKNFVETKLQEEKIHEMIRVLRTKYPIHTNTIQYISSTESGSASKIAAIISGSGSQSAEGELISYEIKPIRRHTFFLMLSLVFFASGIVISELRSKKLTIISILCAVPFFMSCSASFKDGAELLQGSFYWHQEKYQNAIVSFLQVIESAGKTDNRLMKEYGMYNLAVTYMKQNENESALTKLTSISADAPPYILFASFYNCGIIEYEHKNFPQAAFYFKEALKIQPSDLDAKINLELSLLNAESQDEIPSGSVSPFSEKKDDTAVKDAVFSIIRESEQNRWRNQQVENTSEGGLDY